MEFKPRIDKKLQKRPRVDEHYRHAPSGWRFRAYQSPMLRYAAADNLADRAGVHPNPHVTYESRLEIYASSDASDGSKGERRVINIRTLDVLGGMRMSWRRSRGESAIGTTLAINPKHAKGGNNGKRRVLFQHLPHTLRRNEVFCGDTQENEWSSFDYALPADMPPLVVPQSQHSASWSRSRVSFNTNSKNCRPFETDSDWTYTVSAVPRVTLRDTAETYRASRLPMDLLADRRLPILFYAALTYFEDELDDSGAARYEVKLRVQDHFFFLLVRNDVRVDGVLARRLDARLFGNLGREPIALPPADGGEGATLPPGSVLREWSHEEVSFQRLRERGDLRGVTQTKDVSTMFRSEDLRYFAGTVFSS